MSPSCVFKLLGGISAILTGALLFAAHVLNLLSQAEHGTVVGPLFAFLGHIAVIFAFFGMYEAQGSSNGPLGLIGIVLSIIGTVSLCAVLYLDIVATYGVELDRLYHGLIPRLIHIVSPIIYGLGIVLFAASLIKARVLPRFGALTLIVGTLLFGVGSELGIAEQLMAVIGASVMGVGFVWLGSALILMGEAQYRRFIAMELAGLYQQ